jgi:four helix bundle protein
MDINEIYSVSMVYSQRIWEIVDNWAYFPKSTMGNQLVRSADSVSANLREGLGRYYFKDRNLFNIYARGSLFETLCWLEKASARHLISEADFNQLSDWYKVLNLQINLMIKQTRRQGMTGNEEALR